MISHLDTAWKPTQCRSRDDQRASPSSPYCIGSSHRVECSIMTIDSPSLVFLYLFRYLCVLLPQQESRPVGAFFTEISPFRVRLCESLVFRCQSKQAVYLALGRSLFFEFTHKCRIFAMLRHSLHCHGTKMAYPHSPGHPACLFLLRSILSPSLSRTLFHDGA